MMTQIEKFAVLLRWKQSRGKGSTMRIADELRLSRKDVLDYVMQLEQLSEERSNG